MTDKVITYTDEQFKQSMRLRCLEIALDNHIGRNEHLFTAVQEFHAIIGGHNPYAEKDKPKTTAQAGAGKR